MQHSTAVMDGADDFMSALEETAVALIMNEEMFRAICPYPVIVEAENFLKTGGATKVLNTVFTPEERRLLDQWVKYFKHWYLNQPPRLVMIKVGSLTLVQRMALFCAQSHRPDGSS